MGRCFFFAEATMYVWLGDDRVWYGMTARAVDRDVNQFFYIFSRPGHNNIRCLVREKPGE
jgi:hypothetical protein